MSSAPHPKRESRGRIHLSADGVAADSTFFLALTCQLRGKPQLTLGDILTEWFASADLCRDRRRWWAEFLLFMPDHLHALVSVSWDEGLWLNRMVQDWKRYTARTLGLDWQRDFFDHRIRSDSDHQEKWHSIQQNPVCAGLVDTYDHWPHVWFPNRIGWPFQTERYI